MARYEHQVDRTPDGAVHLRFTAGSEVLYYRRVFDLWRSDATFVAYYLDALKQTMVRGGSWDHPTLNPANPTEPYRVTIKPPTVRPPTPPKLEFLDGQWVAGRAVLTFHDAERGGYFVVPNRRGPEDLYYDMTSFLQGASPIVHGQFFGALGLLATDFNATSLGIINPGSGWLQVFLKL